MPVSTHTPLSPMFFAVDAGGGETSHGDRSEHSSPYKQQQYVIDIHSNKLYSTGVHSYCMIVGIPMIDEYTTDVLQFLWDFTQNVQLPMYLTNKRSGGRFCEE